MQIESVLSSLYSEVVATILDGETESNPVNLFGTSLLAIMTDSNLSGTSFTFKASNAIDGTYLELRNMLNGEPLTAIMSDSGFHATSPIDFAAVQFLKIVSNTTQSGDTDLTLITRGL